MERIPLKAQARRDGGKNFCRRLRASGETPAVLYGMGGDAIMLSIDTHDFLKSTAKLSGEMAMFSVSAEELGIENQLAVIRELQRDPLSERLVHLDLMRVDLTQPIDVVVPVHGRGNPIGVRDGGVLEQITRSVHLRCLPDLVPPHIEVDVSELAINQSIHVSDLDLGEKIEMHSPATDVLFHVVVPRKIEEEAVAAEAEVGAEGEAAAEGEGAEDKKGE
ncbi:50S ribosomal protein L25 [Candidatus Sumerlaeota bacterium]|nr:50S ribosomal protein L25 [Candidatus Sumerlaeota bacterium]